MPRRRRNAPGPATEVDAPMQAKGNPRPRRRPVARHPGIYYRPRPGGKVAPPYEIRYLDSSGKRRWAVVHGSIQDAKAKRAELLLRRRRGERNEPTRQTFEQYAWAWLERQPGRARTREVHSWALREHLIPYFGRRRLDQITVDDVAAFIAAMRRKGLRGSTTQTALRPLSRILAHAARRGAIPVNPCSQLERGERPKLDDQRPKRILTLEEMQAIIACADGEPYRCLLELMLAAGLRIGEALGLAVCDLDRQHSLIRVEYQLALVAERGDLFTPSALVFASRTGTGLERKVAREALKRAVKAAGLAPPEPALHDLRHSHASMLIALDVPVVDVQRRLGHRKPDTTLRVYAHQWKEREARRSQIGEQLGHLFDDRKALPAPAANETRLALPPAAESHDQ